MRGIEQKVTRVLEGMNALGGYARSLVCTEDGLLVAQSGAGDVDGEQIAAFTSLFDTVVERGTRDLRLDGVDELTLLDGSDQRLVIRPLASPGEPRLFLVLWADKHATWRRNTNLACSLLVPLLEPLTRRGDDVDTSAV